MHVNTVCGHRMALCSEWSPGAVTKRPCAVSDQCVRSPNGPMWWLHTLITNHTRSFGDCTHQSLTAQGSSLHTLITHCTMSFSDWSLTAQVCSVTTPGDHSPHRAVRWPHMHTIYLNWRLCSLIKGEMQNAFWPYGATAHGHAAIKFTLQVNPIILLPCPIPPPFVLTSYLPSHMCHHEA